MPRSRLRLLACLLTLGSLVAACATEATEDPLSVDGDQGFDVDRDLGDLFDKRIAPDTGLGDGDEPTSDEVVRAALEDVDAYWEREYEDLYGDVYEPISGGFWPYGPDSDQPPCGTPAPDYSDIAGNAFFCPSDDLVAWDNVNLIPDMYKEFGGFTLGIIFAHEFGHAIQFRAGIQGPTIMTELQADCFAGAWTGDVAEGNSRFFELQVSDLDKAIAGFLELRDTVGTAAVEAAAHGTGFDRIGAFSDGFEHGLERCAAYPELVANDELIIVEVPFTDEDDFERGGNLPLDEIFELAIEDLEHFWATLFAEQGQTWTPVTGVVAVDPDTDEVECGGETYSGEILVHQSFLCVDSDTIYIDAVYLVPALYEIGDYAVATELARQYVYAAQVRQGNLDDSIASNLQADCLTGIYAASGFTGNRGAEQRLFLSPGDLDEAVIAFLLTSDSSADVGTNEVSAGSAFQRFDAYRSGFLEGTAACDAYLE